MRGVSGALFWVSDLEMQIVAQKPLSLARPEWNSRLGSILGQPVSTDTGTLLRLGCGQHGCQGQVERFLELLEVQGSGFQEKVLEAAAVSDVKKAKWSY